MAGARKAFLHQSMFWSDLGPKIGFEAIGDVDASLKTVSIWAKASPEESNSTEASTAGDDYKKGVIFYLRNNRVVGIVLWNIFGQIPAARRVIRDARVVDDTYDLARLFSVHK